MFTFSGSRTPLARMALLVAVSVAATLTGCASDPDRPGERDGSSGPSPTAEPTAWGALAARAAAADGQVSVDLALDAFATLIGPIPGGEPAAGAATAGQSGTVAVRWILGVWPELGPAQRAAVRSAVFGDQGTSPASSSAEAGSSAVRAVHRSSLPEASADLGQRIRADLDRINADLADRYGLPIVTYDVYVSAVEHSEAAVLATAYPVELDQYSPLVPDFAFHGKTHQCGITVYPPGLKMYEAVKAGAAGSFSYDLAFLAHELYHCMQFQSFDDIALLGSAPDFLIEGSAKWAENKWIYDSSGTPYDAQLRGLLSASRAAFWNYYLGDKAASGREKSGLRQDSLFIMEYSASGFFAHLENVGIDPWRIVPRMIKAITANQATNRERTLNVAVNAADSGTAQFWRAWAKGLMRDPETLGDDWDTTGPGITDYRYLPETSKVDGTIGGAGIGRGDTQFISLQAAAERHRLAVGNPDNAILVVSVAAYGTFAWADKSGTIVEEPFAPDPDTGFTRHAYCIDPDGCTCEDGSPMPIDQPLETAPVPELIDAYVSFTGGTNQGSITLRLLHPEDVCTETEEEFGTGSFRECGELTERQIAGLVGRTPMKLVTHDSFHHICMWSTLGLAAPAEATVLIAGGVASPKVPTWEKFRDKATGNGDDCTRLVAGLRACIAEESDLETGVYAWAGVGSGALATIRAGVNETSALATPAGRLEAIDAVLRAFLEPDPPA